MTTEHINQLVDLGLKLALIVLPLVVTYAVNAARVATDRLITSKTLRADVDTWVKAAQQSIPDKSARYQYVAGLVAQKYPGTSSAQVEALIEASVASLKISLGTFSEATAPAAPAAPPAPTVDTSAVTAVVGQIAALAGQLPAILTPKAPDPAPSTAPVFGATEEAAPETPPAS